MIEFHLIYKKIILNSIQKNTIHQLVYIYYYLFFMFSTQYKWEPGTNSWLNTRSCYKYSISNDSIFTNVSTSDTPNFNDWIT